MRLINRPQLYDADSPTLAPTWNQIEIGAERIVAKIRGTKFNKILVVVRGGMVLSIIISHRFHIKKMCFFQGSRNLSDKPHSYSKLRIYQQADVNKGDRVLIVEDIVYKGNSIDAVIKNVNKVGGEVAAVCSLFMDQGFQSKYLETVGNEKIPYITAFKCKNLKWIRFPWENKIRGEKNGEIH